MGDDASCSFNESFSCTCAEGSRPTLHDAVHTLISRHEVLRATIDPDGSRLHFAPPLTLEIPRRDFSAFSAEKRDAEVKQLLSQAGPPST